MKAIKEILETMRREDIDGDAEAFTISVGKEDISEEDAALMESLDGHIKEISSQDEFLASDKIPTFVKMALLKLMKDRGDSPDEIIVGGEGSDSGSSSAEISECISTHAGQSVVSFLDQSVEHIVKVHNLDEMRAMLFMMNSGVSMVIAHAMGWSLDVAKNGIDVKDGLSPEDAAEAQEELDGLVEETFLRLEENLKSSYRQWREHRGLAPKPDSSIH